MKMVPNRRSLIMRTLLFFAFFFLGGVSVTMSIIAAQGDIEELESVDAILVLGASKIGGEPSSAFRARLDRARELYNRGFGKRIIVTGGIGEGASVSDSRIGKEYLVQRGIPADVLLIEERSRTTRQNIIGARTILDSHGLHTSLLVSHDFHMMRAKKIARDLGLVVFSAPVRTKSQLQYLQYSFRETCMTFLYLLFKV
ncbi:YdcF family protein [Candidatus Uhrbacteria bacterium]|nr:YdcF family protein [Candidatus Uhrbacteria bacterium]